MIGTKFDMCIKSLKKCNLIAKFSKYVVMLIFLKKPVALGYNKSYN